MIKLKNILKEIEEAYEPKSPPEYVISKQEEDEAFEALKRIVLPFIVLIWNKKMPKTFKKVTIEALRKTIKKVEMTSGPGGDIITYETLLKDPKNYIHRFRIKIYKDDPMGKKIFGTILKNSDIISQDFTWRLI